MKELKKLKKTFAVLLVVCLLGGTLTANAQTFYSSSWMIKQEQTNWCWAAVAEMMASTRTDTFRNQTQIVTNTYGAPYNRSGNIQQMADGAAYSDYYNDTFLVEYGTFPGSRVQSLLSANWTVGAGAFTSGGGHAFAITGYDNSTGEVLLFDPWPSNSNCWITILDFVHTGATSNHFKWSQSAY